MSDRKPTLDDLVRDMKADRGPTPDWRSVDEKLFARLEAEPKPAAEGEPAERTGGRLVWIGAAVTLAAAAAALLLVRPPTGPGASLSTAPRRPGAGTPGRLRDPVEHPPGGAPG